MKRSEKILPVSRAYLILGIIGLFFLILVGRLFWLQCICGGWYAKKAISNRLREIDIVPQRGVISDRNGNQLAVSLSTDSLYAVPDDMRKAGKMAYAVGKLAPILGVTRGELQKKLASNGRFVWVEFKLTPDQAEAIRKLGLPGVGIVKTPQRYYPNGSLAAQVLGVAGDFNQGLEGVEASYDRELSGTPGKEYVECDAIGRQIPNATDRVIGAKNGLNVVLTIDRNIQYFAEAALDNLVKEVSPKSATIVVLDPRSGEVLAMASRPTFDPNNFKAYTMETRRNLAISSIYEPGSTFKVVTLGAALEMGLAHDSDSFYCPGYIMVGKKRINCWKPDGHGQESLADIVANSCNPGFITLGMKLGKENLYKYINGFGFGRPLGIDLPGESGGLVIPEKEVRPLDLASISIGQVNAATPLQIVSAMAAVANDGKLMKPYIVKELQDENGRVVKRFKPQVLRQVLSETTVQKEKALLQGVVDNGTGKNARIEGYTVAGKTGTAEKPMPGGGYSPTDKIVSFCGFAPVDNPRIAALVVVDTPHNVPVFGGTICAPPFRYVVENSLRYLKVPRHLPPKTGSDGKVSVPRVVNLTLSQAFQMLNGVGLRARYSGKGSVVVSQFPAGGAVVDRDRIIYLSLQAEPPAPQVMVPQLEGLTIREAADLLEARRLRLIPLGKPYCSGLAVEQDPPAGSYVARDSGVRVTFKPVVLP